MITAPIGINIHKGASAISVELMQGLKTEWRKEVSVFRHDGSRLHFFS
jgi:hypothetical protein